MIIQRRIAALCSSFNDAGAIAESCPEKDICVREESLFAQDSEELRPTELCAEQHANVLHVQEVQRHVDLIQGYCHQRGLELKQCHDQ